MTTSNLALGGPVLLPQHARLIEGSAIAPEVARARGYRSVETCAELAELGFARSQQLVPALLVPVWNVRGEIATHQLRPDAPRVNARGKVIKYETPRASKMVVDVPPAVRPSIGDPSIPLWITEGVRKADAAVSKGLACIALLGVWNWRGKNASGGTTVLADFEAIALKRREVLLCFDSDVTRKDEVRGALIRLKGLLESRGARVKVVLLPDGEEKVGLDDFLAAGHTVEELLALACDGIVERAPVPPSDLPRIQTGPEIKRMVDEAEAALARSPLDIYSRMGELVRVVQDVKKGCPKIEPLPLPSLTEILSDVALWVGKGGTGKPVRVKPPRDATDALAVRGTWPKIRQLSRVVTAPTIRSDGTVLEAPGHDAESGILLRPSTSFPSVPTRIGFTDALAALEQLKEPFCDFPFVDRSDRSAALALVLTLVARDAIDGPCPLFAVRAPERGAGKTLVVDVAAGIAMGVIPWGRSKQTRDSEEEEKRLLSLGREGTPLLLIDNVARSLGSDVLAAAITSTTFKGRVLGSNRTMEVTMPVFAATGCNLQLAGDLGRRVVPIDVDPRIERPEERTGFRIPDLKPWVKANRPRLIVAALTVLRWFFAEGRPQPELSSFGSFEAWSGIVRAALVSLGEADPCEGRARIREDADPDAEAHRELVEVWHRELGDREHTVAEIITEASKVSDFKHALAALDSKLDADRLDQRRLSYVLRRFRGRIVNGFKLESLARNNHVRQWRVARVKNSISLISPISPPSPSAQAAPRSAVGKEKGDEGDGSPILARERASTEWCTPRAGDVGAGSGVLISPISLDSSEVSAESEEAAREMGGEMREIREIAVAPIGQTGDLLSAEPASEVDAPQLSGEPRSLFPNGEALRAQGWTGPGPIETCVVCGHVTAWRDPSGAPRHSRCTPPPDDESGCNAADGAPEDPPDVGAMGKTYR